MQRPLKDTRENQHIVDLIGIITAAGADHLGAPAQRFRRVDLRFRICQGKDNSVLHAGNHFRIDKMASGNADHNVRADQRIRQLSFAAKAVRIFCQFFLHRIQARIVRVQNAVAIT